MEDQNNEILNQSYCLKCKCKNQVKDVVEKTTKNNRKYIQGLCSVCNTRVNQFLKNDKSDKQEKLEKLLKE